MTTPSRISTPASARKSPEPTCDSFALLASLFDAQWLQWDALFRWQRSLMTLQKDFWEQWAVRFAGGAPMDG